MRWADTAGEGPGAARWQTPASPARTPGSLRRHSALVQRPGQYGRGRGRAVVHVVPTYVDCSQRRGWPSCPGLESVLRLPQSIAGRPDRVSDTRLCDQLDDSLTHDARTVRTIYNVRVSCTSTRTPPHPPLRRAVGFAAAVAGSRPTARSPAAFLFASETPSASMQVWGETPTGAPGPPLLPCGRSLAGLGLAIPCPAGPPHGRSPKAILPGARVDFKM